MKALFGLAVNSLSSAQKAIESKLGPKTVRLLLSSRDKLPTTKKVLLIPNTNTLRSNIKRLNEWDGVAVVFDSPINLYEVEKLEWLDVKSNGDVLSYKFGFIEPKYSKLFAAYDNTKHVRIKMKKQEILQSLVLSRSETEFLETWNNFLYFCTNHSNREQCKKLLLDFFSEKLSLDKLKQSLTAMLRPDQVDYYKNKIIDWLKTSQGVALKEAWLALGPDVDVIKSAKNNAVELKDLKYILKLHKLYRKVTT